MSETTTETVDVKADAEAETKETAADGRKSYDEGYVKSLRDESRKRMERAQTAEAERDALRKKIEEAERAELEKKGEIQKLLEKERDDRKRIEDESSKKLTAADRRFILSEAKGLAIREGIIDPSDVKHAIDLSDMRIDDNDEIPGLAEKIAALKASKAHWFKQSEQKAEERKRPPVPPERKDGGAVERKDWSRAKDGDVRDEMRKYGVTF